MSYELSVVIPVYNVENYIGQCLDSVVNQSIGIDNIEVIIVNDATLDNSMDIVNEYTKKYPSFKVINNETNLGLGQSRNIGLFHATSDYVTFLDSDDFISENAYEDSINKIKESGCDLLIYNWEVFTDDGHIEPESIHNQNTQENRILEDISDFAEIFLLTSAWNKIYHKSLFKYLNYSKGYYEDNIVTANVLLNSNKIYLNKDAVYYYRKNSSSITTNIELKNISDLSDVIKALFEFESNYPQYFKNIKLLIIKFLNDILFYVYYYDWPINEEILMIDKLKESVGEITKEDLDYFRELFPQYPTFYRDDCLNLHEYDSETFLAKYKYYNRLAKVKSTASLYIDEGMGFSEDSKISIDYVPQKNNNLTFDLSNFSNIVSIRFDPLEGAFIKSKVNNIEITDANCDNSVNDDYQIFLTLDPNYILNTDLKDKLTIDFDIEFLDNNDLQVSFIEKNNIIQEKNNINQKEKKSRFNFLK